MSSLDIYGHCEGIDLVIDAVKYHKAEARDKSVHSDRCRTYAH